MCASRHCASSANIFHSLPATSAIQQDAFERPGDRSGHLSLQSPSRSDLSTCHQLSMVRSSLRAPRTTVHFTHVLFGLTLLTSWPHSDIGARHCSRSRLYSKPDEHARQLLKGKYPFTISFISSSHSHSPLLPLEAGNTQRTGTVSIRLVPSMNLYGEFGAQNNGSILNPARPFHGLDGKDGTRSKLHGGGAGLLVSPKRLHSFGSARIVDAGRALCTHSMKYNDLLVMPTPKYYSDSLTACRLFMSLRQMLKFAALQDHVTLVLVGRSPARAVFS